MELTIPETRFDCAPLLPQICARFHWIKANYPTQRQLFLSSLIIYKSLIGEFTLWGILIWLLQIFVWLSDHRLTTELELVGIYTSTSLLVHRTSFPIRFSWDSRIPSRCYTDTSYRCYKYIDVAIGSERLSQSVQHQSGPSLQTTFIPAPNQDPNNRSIQDVSHYRWHSLSDDFPPVHPFRADRIHITHLAQSQPCSGIAIQNSCRSTNSAGRSQTYEQRKSVII